jgi:hypothetical protein
MQSITDAYCGPRALRPLARCSSGTAPRITTPASAARRAARNSRRYRHLRGRAVHSHRYATKQRGLLRLGFSGMGSLVVFFASTEEQGRSGPGLEAQRDAVHCHLGIEPPGTPSLKTQWSLLFRGPAVLARENDPRSRKGAPHPPL